MYSDQIRFQPPQKTAPNPQVPNSGKPIHIMRKVIYFLHLSGFFSLPNYYKQPWKNQWHRYYSNFIVFTLQCFALSVTLAILIYSIQEFNEFSEKFVDALLCATCIYGLFYLRGHLQQFVDMLDIIEQFVGSHRCNPIVANVIMIEEKVMLFAYGFVAFLIIIGNEKITIFKCTPL
uniref:Uncharacterized protein n=1 Tax=Cacopsylla melanoneura TaxID=428564 RepID=A0A8D8Z806_9HEMI